jgi:hypothetical protein
MRSSGPCGMKFPAKIVRYGPHGRLAWALGLMECSCLGKWQSAVGSRQSAVGSRQSAVGSRQS